MKKFIKLISIFLLPLFILWGLFEVSLRKIPNDYIIKREFLDKNSNILEVLFLGSSHAFRGINPVYIQQKSYNASYVSQSLDLDFEILMKYKENWSNLQTIVIPISYFTLFSNLKNNSESWRVKNYCIYYHLFISIHLSDYFESLSLDIKTNLNRIKSYYFKHKNQTTTDENGYGKFIGTNELIKSGVEAANRHTKNNQQQFLSNLKTLNSIINFSKKRKLNVIFYTPPAYQSYIKNLNKTQLNITFSTLKRITNKNKNVYYFNFLTHNEFISNDFYNADHLNSMGAKKLTQLINLKIDSIQKISIQEKQ
ncbi:MAG TPA: hypothetical protein PK649_00860 [Vicingus sp.]|nr:hypothetical protein [Vicingus sp.]